MNKFLLLFIACTLSNQLFPSQQSMSAPGTLKGALAAEDSDEELAPEPQREVLPALFSQYKHHKHLREAYALLDEIENNEIVKALQNFPAASKPLNEIVDEGVDDEGVALTTECNLGKIFTLVEKSTLSNETLQTFVRFGLAHRLVMSKVTPLSGEKTFTYIAPEENSFVNSLKQENIALEWAILEFRKRSQQSQQLSAGKDDKKSK